MLSGLVLAVMAVALLLFARWGWMRAVSLVPVWLPEEHRSRRIAVVRRGAITSAVAGVVVVAAALAAWLA